MLLNLRKRDKTHSVLFVTVGTTPDPIITSVRSQAPDHVVFICSNETKAKADTILRSLSPAPFTHDTCILPPEAQDDFDQCHQYIHRLMEEAESLAPEATYAADFTGGTKTMTSTLTIAACDRQWNLYVVTGLRGSGPTVIAGTERLHRLETHHLQGVRAFQRAQLLAGAYDYQGAEQVASDALRSPQSPEMRKMLDFIVTTCRVFEAWDRFDHALASQIISNIRASFVEHSKFLDAVCSSRQRIDASFSHDRQVGTGYELVEDLILNAERRASTKRFDDAVGRLYRSLELLMQLRFKLAHNLDTSDLDMSRVPESGWHLVTESRDGKRKQVALLSGYNLLGHFPDDPVFAAFQAHAKPLEAALQIRNHSLFAHGIKPVTETEYKQFDRIVRTLVADCLERLTGGKKRYAIPLQFPTVFAPPQ